MPGMRHNSSKKRFNFKLTHYPNSYFLDTCPYPIVFSPRSLELTLTMLFEDRFWLRLA
jgi:hypothetical protein